MLPTDELRRTHLSCPPAPQPASLDFLTQDTVLIIKCEAIMERHLLAEINSRTSSFQACLIIRIPWNLLNTDSQAPFLKIQIQRGLKYNWISEFLSRTPGVSYLQVALFKLFFSLDSTGHWTSQQCPSLVLMLVRLLSYPRATWLPPHPHVARIEKEPITSPLVSEGDFGRRFLGSIEAIQLTHSRNLAWRLTSRLQITLPCWPRSGSGPAVSAEAPGMTSPHEAFLSLTHVTFLLGKKLI